MFSTSRIALLAIATAFIYIVFNLSLWRERQPLHWDETGYYIYLPALFIYHDVDDLAFYDGIQEKYYLNSGVQNYSLHQSPLTGHKIEKYAIGTCLFEMPFFLIAHWYCRSHTDSYPADGYSTPYMAGVIFAVIFWVLAGLFFLRKFLLRYFSENATALTLILVAFATNLYFYTVFEIGMSHPFSFALFSFLLFSTEWWYRSERKVLAIVIATILGLIAITRPVNILVVVIPLLWPYHGRVAARLAFFRRQVGAISLGLVCFSLVLLIQCGYWKHVSGQWIYYSYTHEQFNFLKPEVWKGLFSYCKGWFVYTPIAFIAMFGFIPLFKMYRRLALLVTLYLCVIIYVVFCWWDWSYGGSFGCRPLIEAMPVVAIPLAALISWVVAKKKIVVNALMFIVFGFLITLNMFQSYQLMKNLTVWDHTNRAFYWRSFLKLNVTEEDKKVLEVR